MGIKDRVVFTFCRQIKRKYIKTLLVRHKSAFGRFCIPASYDAHFFATFCRALVRVRIIRGHTTERVEEAMTRVS